MPTAAAPPTEELDTAARLRMALGKISRLLRRSEAASAAGLTPTRVSVLLTVVRQGPIRMSELAASEALNPTMLSRVVADLAQDGLVQRTSDPTDRRSAWVAVTPAGKRLAERMRRERTEAVEHAMSGLGDTDRQALRAALPALEQLANLLDEADQ